MAEQLKFELRPGPWSRREKLREFVRAEIDGTIVMIQKCAECGEFTDQPVVCQQCQKEGEICR